MRTKNSMINIVVSIISYAIVMLGGVVTRKVFIYSLGLEINGVDGSFVDIVNALAIVEMGLGVGIVYTLYKPISEGDWPKISSILSFLKKSYMLIAAIVLGLGIVLSFSVAYVNEYFSKGWLSGIFMLYVADILSSYLFSHKRALFIADQKNYVNNAIHIFAQVFLFVSQVLVLNVFKSFELYLICKIIFRLAEHVTISILFDRKYKSLINLKKAQRLTKFEKKGFFRNIKALLFHKIAGFSLTSTSSFLILKFVSPRDNGIYRNYILIFNALISVSNEFFNGIIASFGNLLSTESKEKIYNNFKILYFINFLIYSFFTVSFFNLINPFIAVWIPERDAVFPIFIVAWLSAYLYTFGIRQSLLMVKVSAGIYNPDKYFAILEAIVTFGLSLVLVQKIGIIGILVGNITSMMLIPNITQPYLVYNMVFKNKELKRYYLKYVIYAALTVIYTYISFLLCSRINVGNDWLKLLCNLVVCLAVPNLMNIVIFYKTDEFQRLFSYLKGLLRLRKA